MPGVYRLKTCPCCGKEHRGRGPYCSKSCSNRTREFSEETKNKISLTLQEHYMTPEGVASAHMQAQRRRQLGIDNAKRAAGEYVLEPDYYALDVPFNMNTDDFDDDVKINW